MRPNDLLLNREEVRELLDLSECITAVAAAFRAHAEGKVPIEPGILGAHIGEGGFHVKTAALAGSRILRRQDQRQLSRQSGPVRPADDPGSDRALRGRAGSPLAVMDSIEITSCAPRPRAPWPRATWPARGAADRDHLRLRQPGSEPPARLRQVRPIRRAFAVRHRRPGRRRFAEELGPSWGSTSRPSDRLDEAIPRATSASPVPRPGIPFFRPPCSGRGMFIAAVGSDSPDKQELEPRCCPPRQQRVVDILEQAATIGELHHALEAGAMARADVHAELGQILAGSGPAGPATTRSSSSTARGPRFRTWRRRAWSMSGQSNRGGGTGCDSHPEPAEGAIEDSTVPARKGRSPRVLK